MENLFTPDCIRTHSGIYVNVFEPTVDMICIEDIAHGLAHTCRFAGHTSKFYSVAQHSVRVYETTYVETTDKVRTLGLKALLHDATEAYLCDIPSPIKKKLPDYIELERNLLRVIFEKFGLDEGIPEEVKEADMTQLQFEWDNLVIRNNPYATCFDIEFAKDLFLFHANVILK